MTQDNRAVEILLVEDNEGDMELTREAFNDAVFSNNLHIAEDGDIALDYLFKRNGYEDAVIPDIILLDLNLPSTDGKEVLEIVKSNASLKRIPIIVLTSSKADKDIFESYDLHANCYIVKPVSANKFMKVVQEVEKYWRGIVRLPSYND